MVLKGESKGIPNMSRAVCMDALANIGKRGTISGTWPAKTKTASYMVRRVISFIISAGLDISLGVGAMMSLSHVEELNDILLAFLAYSNYFGKLVGFLYNEKTCLELLDMLKSDLFNEQPIQYNWPLQVTARRMNRLDFLFGNCMLACAILFALKPIFDDKALPVNFPFDLGIYHYPMYVFQISGFLVGGLNCVSMDLTVVGVLSIVAAQIDILRERLMHAKAEAEQVTGMNLVDEDGVSINLHVDVQIHKIIRDCVIHHYGIIGLLEKIEIIFAFPILIQYITSMVVICNNIIQIVIMNSPTSTTGILSVFHAFTILLQVGLYHYYGNKVFDKSVLVGDACYFMEWYECSIRTQRELGIIMERTIRPLYITVYKFTIVSLASYVVVIRWAYSIYTLFSAVYG